MKYLMFQFQGDTLKEDGTFDNIPICALDCDLTHQQMKELILKVLPWAIEQDKSNSDHGHMYGDILVIDMPDRKASEMLNEIKKD